MTIVTDVTSIFSNWQHAQRAIKKEKNTCNDMCTQRYGKGGGVNCMTYYNLGLFGASGGDSQWHFPTAHKQIKQNVTKENCSQFVGDSMSTYKGATWVGNTTTNFLKGTCYLYAKPGNPCDITPYKWHTPTSAEKHQMKVASTNVMIDLMSKWF